MCRGKASLSLTPLPTLDLPSSHAAWPSGWLSMRWLRAGWSLATLLRIVSPASPVVPSPAYSKASTGWAVS